MSIEYKYFQTDYLWHFGTKFKAVCDTATSQEEVNAKPFGHVLRYVVEDI